MPGRGPAETGVILCVFEVTCAGGAQAGMQIAASEGHCNAQVVLCGKLFMRCVGGSMPPAHQAHNGAALVPTA
eukprot:1151045-Pelagomonas_calceolata.AAC.7